MSRNKYPTCPRCNGDWVSGIKYQAGEAMDCKKCGMIWLPIDNVMFIYFSDVTYLYWDFDYNRCLYINTETLAECTLPLVSFQISFDKLKLYCLFS